jgi:hypothetical protein
MRRGRFREFGSGFGCDGGFHDGSKLIVATEYVRRSGSGPGLWAVVRAGQETNMCRGEALYEVWRTYLQEILQELTVDSECDLSGNTTMLSWPIGSTRLDYSMGRGDRVWKRNLTRGSTDNSSRSPLPADPPPGLIQ